MEFSNGPFKQADGFCLLLELTRCGMLPERLALVEFMALQHLNTTSGCPFHVEGKVQIVHFLTMVSMVSMLLLCDGICTYTTCT